MDLYEALKAGTSADELLDKFYEELNAANERITAEKEEAAAAARAKEDYEQRLSVARIDAADFLADYFNTLFENDEDIHIDATEIEDILVDLEESAKNMFKLLKMFDTKQNQKKPVIKIKYPSTDDEIIARFLQELKK